MKQIHSRLFCSEKSCRTFPSFCFSFDSHRSSLLCYPSLFFGGNPPNGWPYAARVCILTAQSGTCRLFISIPRRRERDLSNYFLLFLCCFFFPRHAWGFAGIHAARWVLAEMTASSLEGLELWVCCISAARSCWQNLHCELCNMHSTWFWFFFLNWQLSQWTLDGIVAVQEACFFFSSGANRSWTNLR